mgnify:CR=1 FL=1
MESFYCSLMIQNPLEWTLPGHRDSSILSINLYRYHLNHQAEMSYDLGMQYYELIKSQTDVKISASALVAAPIPYRDDNRYIWDYEENSIMFPWKR